MALIECVPNFSEGRDLGVINKIADAIKSVIGVRLLHVDHGEAANRTVITFAGEPAAVTEAAYRGIKTAGELIDMRKHKGEHPRMGATDVCPLVPLSGITIDELGDYATALGKRVGYLGIPVYMYEHSQPDRRRSNLSVIRSGEYEGFFEKIRKRGWEPDFGPSDMDAKRGATVIGARNLLIAYNVNLDTASVKIAGKVAALVRESGRKFRQDDGTVQQIPGTLKSVKAIGWYIEDVKKAQVSMNLTDVNVTPIHIAYEEVSKQASSLGAKVTGSELIGLIPLNVMTQAGRYFAAKQGLTASLSEADLIDIAVTAMGLDELLSFNPKERIIEYLLS